MKKTFSVGLLSLLAAALLTIPSARASGQPAAPEGWRSPFSDVREGDWSYPYVAQLHSRGAIAGYPDGRFGPNDAISAGDAVLLLVKAAGSGALPPLQDTHYAMSYVQYAASRDWLTWEELPPLSGPVTRLFTARLAAKALGLSPAEGPSPFADVADGYVTALYQMGVVAGVREGDVLLFHPGSPLTRAEVCVIALRVAEDPEHIVFEGQTIPVLPGVPACSYAAEAFAPQGDRMTCSAPGASPALGIDVSSHQGEIDWSAVAGDGVEFAMLRAGGRYYGKESGQIFADKYFSQNLAGAQAAGLETGAYFFSQAVTVEEAEEEAQALLAQLDGLELSGPVVFDWEVIDYAPARTDGVDGAAVTAMAKAFCRKVEQAGYTPMIYFNPGLAYLVYDLEEVADYPFWLAHYQPQPGFYYDFQIWQYTDSGRVAGIDGPVDMDLRLVPWD